MVALADIYNVPPEQLLRSMYPANSQPALLRQLSLPNATLLLTEGPLEDQARYLLPDTPVPEQTPEETTLVGTENSH